MVARIASFEGVNVEAARATMDEAEAAVRPLVEGLAGFRGILELLSDDGKFQSVTFFESAADVDAAASVFEQEMPAKLGHLFQQWEGRRVSVDVFDVLAHQL